MRSRLLRLIYYGLPALVVAVSVLALNSGILLKRPSGEHDDVAGHLRLLLHHADTQRWEEARDAARKAGEAWLRMRGRIHLTSARDEVETFDLELAGLRGALETGDPVQARIAVHRLLALWEDLGS
ncbi:DUF4363 family protein [Symbiobacterium thermophilum]|uniref:DUF4363 domain-containing protein n=2 Tax=Symbiobacterium thermophilum TaxID=2734 RepID=Q67J98_SYMTH|nr:DUF4363 family protein [Symbiobacterium thermophilum]MBY6275563.1 hypothetical protein [Symbiobacterium thermophilum]BAD42252.1 conserved hypothetical protein [Symbiobacterium thermophilum IAM 14863]